VNAPLRPATTVRRATAAEWSALRDLRLRALRTDPTAFGSTLAREQEYDERLWRDRAERGATSRATSTWVAEGPSGELVGMATVSEVEGTVNVFAMWVDPGMRGVGVGGALLDAGLAWAGSAFPRRPVRLEVNPKQTAAVRLYESRGFRRTGRTEPLGHTPGEVVREMIRPSTE
jgi:ribosomal protein S18 acetylase RimI-like enzyme